MSETAPQTEKVDLRAKKEAMKRMHLDVMKSQHTKVDPVKFAQQRVRAFGLEFATKDAAKTLALAESVTPDEMWAAKSIVFWRNVLGYLKNKGGKKFLNPQLQGA